MKAEFRTTTQKLHQDRQYAGRDMKKWFLENESGMLATSPRRQIHAIYNRKSNSNNELHGDVLGYENCGNVSRHSTLTACAQGRRNDYENKKIINSNCIQGHLKVPELFCWWRNINFFYICIRLCFSDTWRSYIRSLHTVTYAMTGASLRLVHRPLTTRIREIMLFATVQMRSPFCEDMAMRRWVIGSRRFWTTMLSRKAGHQSPSDAAPYPRRTDTSK
jgi:hypothetical protein